MNPKNLRGGSWWYEANNGSRSANRMRSKPEYTEHDQGFRLTSDKLRPINTRGGDWGFANPALFRGAYRDVDDPRSRRELRGFRLASNQPKGE